MELLPLQGKLQWHPAFPAFLQIELEDDAQILQFHPEHSLGKKPLQADILIIKQNADKPVKKALAGAYKGKEKLPSYEAAMDLIIRANIQHYKEDKDMCNALRELFADELKEREDRGLEKGFENGLAESILELLSDIGQIPQTVADAIHAQTNPAILKTWLKLAARADSIGQFITNAKLTQ